MYEENTRIRSANERGRKEVAKRMLEDNVPEEIIIKFTQLPEEELDEVKKKVEKLNKEENNNKVEWWKQAKEEKASTKIKEEAKEEAKREDAKKMKEQNIPIKIIEKVTGLTKEVIEKI